VTAGLAGLPTPTSLFGSSGFGAHDPISNSKSNPYLAGSRRREQQRGQRRQSNSFLRTLKHHADHPEAPWGPGFGRYYHSQDLQTLRAQLQAESDKDRTKRANALLGHRMQLIGQAAYSEYQTIIRAWCEEVGVPEEEPEPMDWQPEQETPVHVVYVQSAPATTIAPGHSPATDGNFVTNVPERNDWEELSLII
jgi:hypothetical protein